MTVAGGPVTDQAIERQIQDAAHVLLDLCTAQNSRMPADMPHPAEFGIAQTLSMAVQAVFMADHLKVGAAFEERMKGHAIGAAEMKARYFGAAVGLGHCIGAATTTVAQAVAIEAVTSGLAHGMEMRADQLARLRKRPG